MLVHPSSIDLSSRTLRYLTGRLAARRGEIGTRWWRLTVGRQALALADLRCGDTYAQLAAGSGIGVTTAYSHIREAVDVPAVLAPTLAGAMRVARTQAFVLLDGPLPPLDRIAADTLYHPGTRKHHDMNVQALTDLLGRLLRGSPALPGSAHDLTAARTHGIVDTLTDVDLKCWAGTAYQGAGGSLWMPLRGRRPKRWQRGHNSTHAEIRRLGGQAMVTLKGWRQGARHPVGQISRNRPASAVTCHDEESSIAGLRK
ncbi:transposase family protein [Streptomyces sp. NPDC087897]|uniref:transposase family protein n=1 Tax=Streptomyces sp. NPDC087897 TaxID=3365817 RepID=UPI00380073BC